MELIAVMLIVTIWIGILFVGLLLYEANQSAKRS